MLKNMLHCFINNNNPQGAVAELYSLKSVTISIYMDVIRFTIQYSKISAKWQPKRNPPQQKQLNTQPTR